MSESVFLDAGVGRWSSNDSRRVRLGRMVVDSAKTDSGSISLTGVVAVGCVGVAED